MLLPLVVFAGLATAISDVYPLSNGKMFQTCAYIDKPNHWIFNERLPPQITVRFPSHPTADFEIETIVLGGPDLNKVNPGSIPSAKVCDEFASNQGYCTFTTDENRIPLQEFLKGGKNHYPAEKVGLHAQMNEDYVYKASSSSVYCVLFMASGMEQEPFHALVDWQQGYGRILVSDYRYLWLCWYMFLAYLAYSAYYGFTMYRMMSEDAANTVLISPLKNKKYLFQYKVLFYVCLTSLVFLTEAVQCAYMNRHGYSEPSLSLSAISFVTLLFNTVLSVWLVYNLTLLCMGVYFKMKPSAEPQTPQQISQMRTKKIDIAKVISAILTVELVLYDAESSSIFSVIGGRTDELSSVIFGELVAIFIVFGLWGLLTCKNIENRALANRMYLTLILLGFCFVFEFILRGTIIQDYMSEKMVRIVNATSYSYLLDFLVTAGVGFIWKDVIYENNEISLKK